MVLFLQKIQVHCHIRQYEVFLCQFTVGFEPLTMNIKIISAIYNHRFSYTSISTQDFVCYSNCVFDNLRMPHHVT